MQRVVSVNVAQPRSITWRGREIQTGIFKEPVNDRVAVKGHSLDGDIQADRRVHGGEDKAVYVYPIQHYEFWRARYPAIDLPWGMFGENLSIEGMTEETVNIGDRWRIGTAEFEITQPREPCFKLGIKFNDSRIMKQFLTSGRSGWYLKVLKEGDLGAGDGIERILRHEQAVTIAAVNRRLVMEAT